MIYEIESEPEEHSLSLSQHSSPSHSDRDQAPAKKVTWLAKTPKLFPVVKQQIPVSNDSQSSEIHYNQFDPETIVDGAPRDIYLLGKNLKQRKPEKIRHGRDTVHDLHFSATNQIPSEAGQSETPVHNIFLCNIKLPLVLFNYEKSFYFSHRWELMFMVKLMGFSTLDI